MASTYFVRVEPIELQQSTKPLETAYQVDEMAVPSYCHKNPLIRWLFWDRLHKALDLLKPQKSDLIWEFGTGSGVLLPSLSAQAGWVVATDLFPAPAEKMVSARGLQNVSVGSNVASVEQFLPDGKANAIVALDVLEHVDDLEATIRLFKSKLTATGRIIVSGPTESPLYKLGRILAGFGDKGDYHHTDINRIERVFLAEGFRIEKKTRIFPAPLPRLFSIYDFRLK